MKITVAITGASGSIYALQLVRKLIDSDQVSKIYVVLTNTAKKVVKHEITNQLDRLLESSCKIERLSNDDFFTPIASGSNPADAMVVIPCSMGMVGRIASGVSNDLISRAADVMIKEDKKLIVVPRETPLSLIHLQNLTKLKQNQVVILPACVSFYAIPKSIEELIDTVVERVLVHLNVDNKNFKWLNDVL